MLDHPGKLVNDYIKTYTNAILDIGEEWKLKQDGKRWKVATVDLFGALQRKSEEMNDPKELYT